MLLFGKILKFQSLAPGQRSLHRSERLAITTGATGMHGIGETRDARITIAAVDGRSYGINRVRRGFGSRRAFHVHRLIGKIRHFKRARRTIFRVDVAAVQRLMRFGFDFGIREVQCGIVGSLLLVTHDFAGMQFDHTLAHGVDDFLVMRCHDDGGASAVDGVQHFHNAQRCGRIEISSRLVGQQNLRMVHIRSRNGHTLCLTAGKLVRIVVFLPGETDSL